ncbi:uncharacterized protein [Littorina saxatilis]|uniref:ZP domain-containing protein n=1 Tax=Littorina saxatilis TaxID=31220 RepID=A0AAN9GNI7_9CAEN
MADKCRLSVLLLATFLAGECALARSSSNQHHGLMIECGPTPDIPTNITAYHTTGTRSRSRHLVGFYTKGTQLQCHSQLQLRGQSYLRVISDVFGQDCGAELTTKGTYRVTVHLKFREREGELVTILTCTFGSDVDTTRTNHTQPEENDLLESEFHLSKNIFRKKRSSKDRNRKAMPPDRKTRKSKVSKMQHKEDISHDVSAMTSSPSVLQLNVIDKDGNMTTVVFPGKQVALELHTSHHTPFGIPVVRECRVTNPLEDKYIDTLLPFSAVIMEGGCGIGDLLPKGSSFAKGKQGYTTPHFSVPSGWTLQTALIFSCDVIICADVKQCQQTCPVPKKKVNMPELYDVTVKLESQVVTSCPPIDDTVKANDVTWSDLLLPECLPEGHRLRKLIVPPERDQNFTASVAESDVKTQITPTSSSSWLAGNFHYVIIIGVLALLIVVFMFATFCKMVAMEKHVERNHKVTATDQRERTASESQHDQMTQTPRPLPRVPPGRSQTPSRQSRQGGDGAPTTSVVHADGDLVVRPMAGGTPYLGYDNLNESFNASTIPHARAFAQTRPKPYDIPPSHDRQREVRNPSVEIALSPDFAPIPNEHTPLHSSFRRHSGEPSTPPERPVRQDSPRRSSEVKSFQTTVDEKNSERHTTIIEIKTPNKPDVIEPASHAWKGHQRLGSFTGNGSINPQERGVVLGVNSLRRHMDRDHQHPPMAAQLRDRDQHHQPMAGQPRDHHHQPMTAQPRDRDQHHQPMTAQPRDRDQHHQPMTAQPRDRRPISAQHCDPIGTQIFYNTPAPCSEDSTLKELFRSPSQEEGGVPEKGGFAGIRTSPRSGSRKGVMPVSPIAVNTVEETTRL